MSQKRGLFSTDGENQRAVQSQSFNGGAPRRSQRGEAHTAPPKVLQPNIASRIEQGNFLFGVRVNGGLPRTFAERAGDASESEIVGGGLTADR